ncbi:MAG: T9SS type A sorting domain-containing protein, partial [candidate division WOR-3 bacterium]
PNIFIDSVYVVSTGDGDKEIEPEENVTIAIRLKNTGANAQNVTAKIVYRTNNALNIPATAVSYGNMQKGQSVTQNFTLSTADVLPQNTRIYLTLRINSTTGNYKKHDFFYLDTWKQSEPSQTKSLRNDNGTAAYYPGNDPEYSNYAYFASRFETVNTGTMISCSIYTYNGSPRPVTCTLFVWNHNSTYNAPGNLIAYRTISIGAAEQWYNFDIDDIPGIPAGYIWVGLRKNGTTTNGVPYQDNDGASTTNKSTNTRNNPSSWTLQNYWYDFLIRPRITYDAIVAPNIFYEGSCIFDDSKAGNGDGWTDPGEQGGLAISLKNLGLNAYNVTGTLQAQDQFTQTYVTIIKNTASFGNAPNGNPSTNNYNDPWIIRISDDCPITGDQDFNFIVNISAQYYPAGSGTPSNYTTTIHFTLSSPFVPYENTIWFIPTGTGGLWYTTSVSSLNRYNFAGFYFGLTPIDSFFVDTLYGVYYNTDNTPDADDIVRLYIYNHCSTNPSLPGGEQIWSVDLGGNQARGWKKGIVNLKVPGFIWPGIYTGGSLFDGVYSVFFGAPFVGYYIRIYSALPTGCAPGDVANGVRPYAFRVASHHDHPTVSYYRPPNWSWPITPTNTTNSTTIPDTLSSWPNPTYANFAILNRSTIDISAPPTPTRKGARDVWDNYLFLDNWGQWNAQVNFALNAWNYAVAQNLELKVPGGRHTLLIGLDWNNEVGGNVFNEYLRYWGMQFSWNPRKLSARNAPKRIRWVPELTGPFAGPYYNCTAYACSVYTVNYQNGSPYGKPWHGIAIRNFNLTWNNDLDLRLYSDKPNDPYSGYTNILESSELGPNVVDFIMIDGRHVGTKYYAGVYSFIEPSGSPPDSTWMHYEAARYVITAGGTTWYSVDDNFTDSTVIHVYDVIINNGQTFQCELEVLSGTQTYFIALYGSQQEDRIKRRIDYLVSGNATPLNPAYLSYTNTGANDTFGLVIVGNLNASGSYRLKFLGTGQPLGTMEIEFSAKCVDEGILLLWGDLSDAKAISIEKANGRGYEKITELPSNSREYIDKNVENGKTYTYRLIAHYDNRDRILGPVTITYISPIPKELTILSMSRNIIKNSGFVRIAVPKKEKVDIEIYDPAGRICKKVFSGYLERGIYEFKIDIDSKGVYFLIVKDREKRIREKLLFM